MSLKKAVCHNIIINLSNLHICGEGVKAREKFSFLGHLVILVLCCPFGYHTNWSVITTKRGMVISAVIYTEAKPIVSLLPR